MKWITRERVKVDRVAWPWLIMRFVASEAQFRFLAKGTDWSSVTNGILLDVPGCELAHHRQDVSFDSILDKYSLNDPARRPFPEIVPAADSNPTNPHAPGEGFRWIARVLSSPALSDDELLNRELILYDAFCAEYIERCTSHASK